MNLPFFPCSNILLLVTNCIHLFPRLFRESLVFYRIVLSGHTPNPQPERGGGQGIYVYLDLVLIILYVCDPVRL